MLSLCLSRAYLVQTIILVSTVEKWSPYSYLNQRPRLVARGVERLRAARRGADLRVALAPAARMPRHVELHHHANTSLSSVLNHVSNVRLQMKQLRRNQ